MRVANIVLTFLRLRELDNYMSWLRNPFVAPPDRMLTDNALLVYAPTGNWTTPPVIHEYMGLFKDSDFSVWDLEGASLPLPDGTTCQYRKRTCVVQYLLSQLLRPPSEPLLFTLQNAWIRIEDPSTGLSDIGPWTGRLIFTFEPDSRSISMLVIHTLMESDGTEMAAVWAEAVKQRGTAAWCGNLRRQCPDPWFPYDDVSACVEDWDARPFLTNNTECLRNKAIASGDSNVCRVVHLESADARPEVHCAHVGRQSAYCNDCMCRAGMTTDACSSVGRETGVQYLEQL
tara:strand:- start:269 stop:1129 length:861 start_codon:yes stop_codon:yes gene_type:complete